LSKSERDFWQSLYHAVRGKYRIFCKVRLADIAIPRHSGREERRWFNKIGRYHVDFVICEPKTTAPLLVIELDDRSHRSARRRERDAFKDAVLAAAGIPLYRVRVQGTYDSSELRRQIQRLIVGACKHES
jgi:very-short-patch-repair endonuclease